MTNTFLHKVIKHIQSRGLEYDKVCIVLPNKRAGVFLKKYLSESIRKPIWAPVIFSIEEFFTNLSGLEQLDNTALCFELYHVYKIHKKETAEPLEEFLKWAPHLITDFSEIDSYLIKGEDLFGNLSNVKELESWSLGQENLTEFQQKYLDFWYSLGTIYTNYKNHLLKNKKGYLGLLQQTGIQNLDEKIKTFQWEHIVFAGFNALNKCEEVLLNRLLESGKASAIWDSDEYYLHNKQQEAGKFLRKYKERYQPKDNEESTNNIVFIEEHLLGHEAKEITVTGAAKNVLQAKVAGDIIEALIKNGADESNTALVLADENLLFPVLNSIPDTVKEINITMGYPLKHSLIAELINILFDLHLRPAKLGKKEHIFYHKDILKFLKHPYLKDIFQKNNTSEKAAKLVYNILNKSMVFVSCTHIKNIFGEDGYAPISKLLETWKTSIDAATCVEYLISLTAANIKEKNTVNDKEKGSIAIEFSSALMSLVKRLQAMQKEFNEISIPALQLLLTQLIKSTAVPFYGEPLNGLQVMGMLETRTLDFENIILVSANEGTLPSAKKNNSFIPFDIRRAFGLPTYADKDSIFAFHFYRLLQRAKKIHLLYNTEMADFGSGEKSRFITQLIHELPLRNNQIILKQSTLNSSSIINREQKIEIQKSAEVLNKIKIKAQNGLSPSSLNAYRNCSLRFYFQQIANIRESEEVEETIGSDTLGNIVHKSLQSLYLPHIGKIISSEIVKQMLIDAATIIEKHFSEDESVSETTSGKNLLIVSVAKKFVHNHLKTEIRFIEGNAKQGKQLIIQALEKELTTTIKTGDNSVLLKGICDRIDATGKTLRIIDYKTGSALPKELQVNSWEEINTAIELNKSFQLLMYALLYAENAGDMQQELISGIISFRELSAGLKTVKVNGSEILTKETLENFKNEIKKLLSELFDPNLPFIQTTNEDVCIYCAYKNICNR